MIGLWSDLKGAGVGYLSHSQNQTSAELPLSKEERQQRLERKHVFLETFVPYMQMATTWLTERHDYHIDTVQRSAQDALFWETTETALQAYMESLETVASEETAVNALRLFQDEIRKPFLEELTMARGLRDFAKPLLKGAAHPSFATESISNFTAAIRAHFETQGAGPEHMSYIERLEESVEDSTQNAAEFMEGFLSMQNESISSLLEEDQGQIQENARLMTDVFVATTLAEKTTETPEILQQEINKAQRKAGKSRALIEASELQMSLFMDKAQEYSQTHRMLAAAFTRIQGELEEISETVTSTEEASANND